MNEIRKELIKIVKQEGNKKEFEYKGYKCLILRHRDLNHLCGYVGLTEENIFFKKNYNDMHNIYCHGGLTFSGFINDEKLWYIGFDCAHAGDMIPFKIDLFGFNLINLKEETYKDMSFVENELKDIIDQLIEKIRKIINFRTSK